MMRIFCIAMLLIFAFTALLSAFNRMELTPAFMAFTFISSAVLLIKDRKPKRKKDV